VHVIEVNLIWRTHRFVRAVWRLGWREPEQVSGDMQNLCPALELPKISGGFLCPFQPADVNLTDL
jgi:hypothetical protein